MSKRLDLVGQRFGKLMVLKFSGTDKRGATTWECKCDCGNIKIIGRNSLKYGSSRSCGCLQKSKLSKRQSGSGNVQYVHGLRKSRFYGIFYSVLYRCNNKKNVRYKDYGGRGIECEWKSFLEFKKDMYESYIKHIEKYGEENTSIDRINNNGNYYKENCKWSTHKEQQRNTRYNKNFIYRNKQYCVSALYEKLKPPVSLNVFYVRLTKYKWNIEKAIKPLRCYTITKKK